MSTVVRPFTEAEFEDLQGLTLILIGQLRCAFGSGELSHLRRKATAPCSFLAFQNRILHLKTYLAIVREELSQNTLHPGLRYGHLRMALPHECHGFAHGDTMLFAAVAGLCICINGHHRALKLPRFLSAVVRGASPLFHRTL